MIEFAYVLCVECILAEHTDGWMDGWMDGRSMRIETNASPTKQRISKVLHSKTAPITMEEGKASDPF